MQSQEPQLGQNPQEGNGAGVISGGRAAAVVISHPLSSIGKQRKTVI